MSQILTTQELDSLQTLVARNAKNRGLELLRVEIRGTRSRPVFEIILDGERQVSIEDCEVISKAVQAHLDESLGSSTNYRLDVLSPGVDEPLIHPYQFRRSIGRKIEVQTDAALRSGRLKSVTDNGIVLAEAAKSKPKESLPQEFSILFGDIRKAKVLVEL